MNAQSPPVPATSSVIAYTSPPVPPIKSEHAVSIMQRERPGDDGGLSSGSERRLYLEARKRVLKHELANVQLKLGIDDRRKKKEGRERKAAKARRPGVPSKKHCLCERIHKRHYAIFSCRFGYRLLSGKDC